ncbi:uncharacterized protein [Nicotiana tomentosiformis]|uniref:uncharacterized protein n=1 Tax=Nicotiana tomentosiformis TaxID=4098 RepID=UPI00388CE390
MAYACCLDSWSTPKVDGVAWRFTFALSFGMQKSVPGESVRGTTLSISLASFSFGFAQIPLGSFPSGIFAKQNHRLRAKPSNVVIKHDITKAYGRVSLKYRLHVLRAIVFAENFITMIRSLLSNNWYFVLVNADVLSRSLNKLFDHKSFIGFGMPKLTDPLNHLAYSDDTIIFASAHPESLKNIMAVLNGYEKILGQLINKAKSSYYMHSKAANSLFQTVGDLTGFTRGEFPFTYLGCPIFYS